MSLQRELHLQFLGVKGLTLLVERGLSVQILLWSFHSQVQLPVSYFMTSIHSHLNHRLASCRSELMGCSVASSLALQHLLLLHSSCRCSCRLPQFRNEFFESTSPNNIQVMTVQGKTQTENSLPEVRAWDKLQLPNGFYCLWCRQTARLVSDLMDLSWCKMSTLWITAWKRRWLMV